MLLLLLSWNVETKLYYLLQNKNNNKKSSCCSLWGSQNEKQSALSFVVFFLLLIEYTILLWFMNNNNNNNKKSFNYWSRIYIKSKWIEIPLNPSEETNIIQYISTLIYLIAMSLLSFQIWPSAIIIFFERNFVKQKYVCLHTRR